MLLNFRIFSTNRKFLSRTYISLSRFSLVKVIYSTTAFVFDISNKKFNKVTIVLIEIRQTSIVKQSKDSKFLIIIKNVKFLSIVKYIEVSTTIEDIIVSTTLTNAIFEKKTIFIYNAKNFVLEKARYSIKFDLL